MRKIFRPFLILPALLLVWAILPPRLPSLTTQDNSSRLIPWEEPISEELLSEKTEEEENEEKHSLLPFPLSNISPLQNTIGRLALLPPINLPYILPKSPGQTRAPPILF